MAPPPIQSRHRKPITYGRISHSNSTNFRVFQDTVEGSNSNDEPKATVPRRIRAPAPLPPSLPPMAEQSPPGSGFDSVYHISNGDKEDPFSDPPTLNPQVPTGLAYTNEVKQSVWPSQSRKVALAEKSGNHPILRKNTIDITSNATSPGDTDRNSGPPPRPHKIRHYAPTPEGQDLSCSLSPSKAQSPISKDIFRRFSTGAAEKEGGMPYNTPPAGSVIDRHGMADGNTRADAWVRGEPTYVQEKAAERMMGSSPPSPRYSSHYGGAAPTPLKKTFGGGVRKTLSPRYSIERMKKRKQGYEPVPTPTDCETEYESDVDSSAKDPFASGQDDGFERRIFAGESSDYIAEVPKRRRGAQEPYNCDTRAQSTQNLLAQKKEVDPSAERAGTWSRSRGFKYDAELGDKGSEDWDERESSIAGTGDSLMACMSGSSESVSPGPAAQPSKRKTWGQLKTTSKTKSKKRAGKPLPLKKMRNSRSKLLGSAGDTSTGSTVDSGTEGSTVDVAQRHPGSISTAPIAGGIKHHGVRNNELLHDKALGGDGLGSWDTPGGCNLPASSLLVRADTQNATYPDGVQTGGEAEDFRQDSNVPDTGIDKDTRNNTSLGTRPIQGNRRGEKGKPVARPEGSANAVSTAGRGSISSHGHEAIPLRDKLPKSSLHNTKRRKDVKKTKTSKLKVKMVFEDDDVDELQMDLPSMRI